MSESKTYVFGQDAAGTGGANALLASVLPALCQRQGVDPSVLALLAGNRGGGGNGNGWGGDNLFTVLLLFILMGNNGFGGFGNRNGFMAGGTGGVVPFVQNDANTAVIMQAVQRNGFDVQSLATALNTSSDAILAGINSMGMQICNLGTTMGTNTNQILTAIMQGDNGIISQMCSCCCDLKQLVASMGAENSLAICQQTNTLQGAINGVAVGQERGFSNLGFETQKQTCAIEKSIADSTEKILAGQRAAEMREMQNRIDALREENGTYKSSAMTSNIVGQAVAPINAMLVGLQKEVDAIKCNTPEVAKVPYSPVVGVPNCVAYQYGLYGGLPFAGGGFWG